MKYLLYFALGALALRLLDTLWQTLAPARSAGVVVGTPVVCDGGMEFVVTYEGGGESNETITPPWEYTPNWN